MRPFIRAAAALLLLAAAACAGDAPSQDEFVTLRAALSSTQQVPPNLAGGGGDATVTFDRVSKRMTWLVDYYSLSGALTGAHFHGPAASNATAPVTVPMTPRASPLAGSTTLGPRDEADLLAGRWYVNLHTTTHPAGELRGQLRETRR